MKKITLSVLTATAILCSCTSVKQIGSLNMISTRNIDSNSHFEMLRSYAGGSKSELKKSKAETIQDAVNATVKNVAGGEFLMNVKLYMIDDMYFAVEGDVWGLSKNEYRGMKIGDKVSYKFAGKYKNATIKGFRDADTAVIILDNGNAVEKEIEDLIKVE